MKIKFEVCFHALSSSDIFTRQACLEWVPDEGKNQSYSSKEVFEK